MASEFLGVGWGFPVTAQDGAIAVARYEESVRQAIWIVLATAPGERMMRPDFGCGIHDLVFALSGPATNGRVGTLVRRALLRWEPRIDVLDVQVAAVGAGELLLISIDYRVRTTNNVFNLVYPFYISGSPAS